MNPIRNPDRRVAVSRRTQLAGEIPAERVEGGTRDHRWRTLDLQIGTLAVRESVYEGRFQGPKTQRALRTIPLGPNAIAALTAHRARVARTAPEDLVFSNRSGGPRNPHDDSTAFGKGITRSGLYVAFEPYRPCFVGEPDYSVKLPRATLDVCVHFP